MTSSLVNVENKWREDFQQIILIINNKIYGERDHCQPSGDQKWAEKNINFLQEETSQSSTDWIAFRLQAFPDASKKS